MRERPQPPLSVPSFDTARDTARHTARETARASCWLCWLPFALLLCGNASPVLEREPIVLPIAWHVVQDVAGPVVSDAFLSERLERANAIFAPYRVAFAAVARDSLPERHAALEDRRDRDALGAHVAAGVINCFVVRSLRDVDDPTQLRRGVHWHAPSSHFVIISSTSGPNVLAHELGHFLGNPAHSNTAGNLMSYLPGPDLPVLDRRQVRRLERALRAYLARKELRVVGRSADQGS
jgi:hypothetical protein